MCHFALLLYCVSFETGKGKKSPAFFLFLLSLYLIDIYLYTTPTAVNL